MAHFSIGKLSAETGCKIPTIRYYEEEGLLQRPFRTDGNQRRYTEMHLKRLGFIMHARTLGFTLAEVRELIGLASAEHDGHEADVIANRHLLAIELKIERLMALRRELQHMLSACSRDDTAPCQVIEALFDHSLCRGEQQ